MDLNKGLSSRCFHPLQLCKLILDSHMHFSFPSLFAMKQMISYCIFKAPEF